MRAQFTKKQNSCQWSFDSCFKIDAINLFFMLFLFFIRHYQWKTYR